jgi:hypothetical protein
MTEALALVWSCRGVAHRAAVAVWPGQFFVARFIGVERLQGSEKCRRPVRIVSPGNEKLAEEIERPLRAAGDQNVLNGAAHAPTAHVFSDPGPEVGIAFGNGILKGGRGPLRMAQDEIIGCAEGLVRKQRRVWNSSGEGDDVWTREKREQFTHIRPAMPAAHRA